MTNNKNDIEEFREYLKSQILSNDPNFDFEKERVSVARSLIGYNVMKIAIIHEVKIDEMIKILLYIIWMLSPEMFMKLFSKKKKGK